MELIICSLAVIIIILVFTALKFRRDSIRYKSLVDNTNDIIYLLQLNPRREFIYISQSVKRFCGYETDDFYQDPDILMKLTHPDDYPLQEFVRDYPMQNPRPIILRWIKKDGSQIWVEQRLSSIYNKKGELEAVEGVIRNISHQKKEELSLRETSKVFKELFTNTTDCILVHNFSDDGIAGKILFSNDFAGRILEYSAEEIQNRTFSDLFSPEQHNDISGYMKFLSDNGKISFESELISQSGIKIPMEINANITHYQNKKVILSIARDISLRKKMEKELLKNQKLESIGILAGGLAHDFNNYLSVMLGNIDLAINYIGEPEKLKEILIETEKAILKATGLTFQLLTFSKGGMPVKQSASISDVLKETAIFDLRGVNIECQFTIPDDLWPVEFDIGQINQVFNNLIINARQAMPNGGKLDIKAENIFLKDDEVPLLKRGRYIKIMIRDNGIGIAPENLVKIFDPFFTTKEEGSGLGLALSYSIIKKHSGLMTVESKKGKGSAFFIYLPAMVKAGEVKKEAITGGIIKGSDKILVLDDEVMIMKTLGKMLDFLGYKVSFSTTGEEAIEMYMNALKEGDPFDLVIMDLTIQGGMGGDEAIKELLQLHPEICAIVSSGYSTHPIMADYKMYGFKNVISKPYTIKRLSEVVSETIKKNKKTIK